MACAVPRLAGRWRRGTASASSTRRFATASRPRRGPHGSREARGRAAARALRVDVIEAGFAASDGDFEAVRASRRRRRAASPWPRPPAAATATRSGRSRRSRSPSGRTSTCSSRRATSISSTSPHRPRDGAREAVRWVGHGREQLGRDVEIEFSAEDARARTGLPDAGLRGVVEAGASTINIPDTVGYAIPSSSRRSSSGWWASASRRPSRPLSQRPRPGDGQHARGGAGRCSPGRGQHQRPRGARRQRVLEEVDGASARGRRSSVAARTAPRPLAHGVATEHITAASRLVSYLTGFAVQPNKAIVGGNAFAHESGSTRTAIKNPLTYEIMTPQSVGLPARRSRSASSRGARAQRRSSPSSATSSRARRSTRSTARRSSSGREEGGHRRRPRRARRAAGGRGAQAVRLQGWNVTSSHGGKATGMVALTVGDAEHAKAAIGNGLVDALFEAVDAAVQDAFGWHPVLEAYEIKAVSGGEDAQGRVPCGAAAPATAGRAADGLRPRAEHEHHRGLDRGLPRRGQALRRDCRAGVGGLRRPAHRRGASLIR